MTRPPTVPRRLLAALATFATALTLGLATTAATPAAEPARAATPVHGDGDVILNLFQWTWDSVAAECTNVIGPAGFGYVQVSPPTEHIRGTQWWTSYQPVSYRIESKLGTRAEFRNMVAACDAAGVGVIADAVVNHMAGAGQSGTGVAGTAYSDDNFTGTYGAQDFNDCRRNIADYTNRYEVQNCRLVALQDLQCHRLRLRARQARRVLRRPGLPRGRRVPDRRREAHPGVGPRGDQEPDEQLERVLGARGDRRCRRADPAVRVPGQR
jgi:alpha-amylase